MGLLALDISTFGVVMSADSQPVEIRANETRVLDSGNTRTRNPLLIRFGGGFIGLVGFVGTEDIGGVPTQSWLSGFSASQTDATLKEFATGLAGELTEEWRKCRLRSILEILISGVESSQIRYWYVRNSGGLNDGDWTHKPPRAAFHAVDDLDANYIQPGLRPGLTKEELLKTRMFGFRQGVLMPSAPVFDSFTQIMGLIYAQRIDGFETISSLDDIAYLARQRMEFVKRLYSPSHGIYKNSRAPVGGAVHVLGVTRQGEIRRYPKRRSQTHTVLPAPK